MIRRGSVKRTFKEVALRRFKDNVCESGRCTRDCEKSREDVEKCFDMDEYEWIQYIEGGVEYDREDLEREKNKIEKEQKLEEQRKEVREAVR
ncbi:MAG: hypothetical protein ACOC55_01900 [Candidatus Natronoplasma sp.]